MFIPSAPIISETGSAAAALILLFAFSAVLLPFFHSKADRSTKRRFKTDGIICFPLRSRVRASAVPFFFAACALLFMPVASALAQETWVPVYNATDIQLWLDREGINQIRLADKILIPEGKTFLVARNVTIDLNGYTITANCPDTYLFHIYSDDIPDPSLTLIDTSSEKTGAITGNGSRRGVYVFDGSFIMEGGTISGFNDQEGGAGVRVEKGTFTMRGGKITGNSAVYGGGVEISCPDCIFNMEGGEITGNSAVYGGGVYMNANSTFNLSGGTISGNYTGSGEDRRDDNLLYNGRINITGKLPDKKAQVGINSAAHVFTSGLSTYGSPDYFFSDDPGLIVRKNASGEAELVPGWYCGDPDVNNGRDVTCVLDDIGTFTVSGSGAMRNYAIYEEAEYEDDPAPWIGKTIQRFVFEKGITSIGNWAFYRCNFFGDEIRIPEGVTVIGEGAFASSLSDISPDWDLELPASLESIGANAFRVSPVGKVTFKEPSALNSIGYKAFESSYLTSITIPAGVISIGEMAFRNCKKLSAIEVAAGNKNYANNEGDGVLFDADKTTLIQYPAGKRGDGLYQYTIPDGVRTIESYAIAYTSELEYLDIPASVTSIGSFAFKESEFLGMGDHGIIIRRGAEALTLKADVFYDNNIMNPGFKEVQLIAPDEAVLTITPDTDFSISEDMKTLSWTDDSTGAATLKVWYTVVFLDEDGTAVLQSGLAEGAKIPEYTHETPTKASDETYSYTFAGWTPELKAVDGSAVYTAKYTKTPLSQSVKITDPDGKDITGKTVAVDSTEVKLAASASPYGAGQKFFWNSSDPEKASVDTNGTVTFLKAGTAVITVKAADGSGVSAETTIIYVPPAESVKITDPDGKDITGSKVPVDTKEFQLKAVAEPAEAKQEFIWKSSALNTAAVDGNGNVTFSKDGTVTITVKADDRIGESAEVTLTLKAEEDPAEITAEAEVIRGGNTIDLDDCVGSAIGEVSFSINGEDLGCGLDPDSHVLTSGEKTGTVIVTVTVADSDFHYGKTGTVTVSVIEKKQETLEVEQKGAVFGGHLPDPEYSAPAGTISETVLYSGAGYGPSEELPSEPGSYTITVSCETKDTVYTGTADFTIAPKPLSDPSVTAKLLPSDIFTWTGEPFKITGAEVRDGDKLLTEGVDYEITADSVLSAVEVGTYEVTVSADDKAAADTDGTAAKTVTGRDYTGSVTLSWQITLADDPEPEPEPERPRMEFFRLHADCELPATGFSSLRPTVLPEQPKDLRYEPVRMHLMLPTLEQEIELVTIPREGNSWAAAWLGADAGILEGSALPGEGISIIAAHNTLNDTNYGPFALLSTLEVNDTVMIRDESGALKLFRVYANELLEPDDMERLSALAGDDALVLLTCENESASGGYLNRRAVFAKENKK